MEHCSLYLATGSFPRKKNGMARRVFFTLAHANTTRYFDLTRCTVQPLNDMVAMCYGGRYVIMLNGIFGAYVGFMYNEIFAFPMNWFGGTHWKDGEMEVPFLPGSFPLQCHLARKLFALVRSDIFFLVRVLHLTRSALIPSGTTHKTRSPSSTRSK